MLQTELGANSGSRGHGACSGGTVGFMPISGAAGIAMPGRNEDRVSGRIGIADLLEPVLDAADLDEAELGRAVNLVAEAMAALNIAIRRPDGRAVPGLSDEKAVLYLLRCYRQILAYESRLEDALILRDLARRIERLELSRWERGVAPPSR